MKSAREISGRLAAEANPDALFKHVKTLAAIAGKAGEPSEKTGKGQGQTVEIEYYWAILGYVSDVKAVPLENLVVYTAAHEIAHAFIRCGYDASGCAWEPGAYAATESKLRETLADYYALQTLRRLEPLIPGLSGVFDLWHDGNAERLHVRDAWIDAYQPELVRHVLIPMRRSGDCRTLAEFERLLEAEKPKFEVRARKQDDDLFGGDV